IDARAALAVPMDGSTVINCLAPPVEAKRAGRVAGQFGAAGKGRDVGGVFRPEVAVFEPIVVGPDRREGGGFGVVATCTGRAIGGPPVVVGPAGTDRMAGAGAGVVVAPLPLPPAHPATRYIATANNAVVLARPTSAVNSSVIAVTPELRRQRYLLASVALAAGLAGCSTPARPSTAPVPTTPAAPATSATTVPALTPSQPSSPAPAKPLS